jgi:hypothetical protein
LWQRNGIKPRPARRFKLSRDPGLDILVEVTRAKAAVRRLQAPAAIGAARTGAQQ